MKTPLGDQHSRLHVTIKRGVVAALMVDATGDSSAVQDATIAKGKLTFSIEVPQPVKIKLRFAVAAEGDALTGTYRPGIFPPFAVSGVRVK